MQTHLDLVIHIYVNIQHQFQSWGARICKDIEVARVLDRITETSISPQQRQLTMQTHLDLVIHIYADINRQFQSQGARNRKDMERWPSA
jgi:hypothetical protein